MAGSSMTPTTVRLDEERLAFLATLALGESNSNAEKIRMLIDEGRLLREGLTDYKSALTFFDRFASRAAECVRIRENECELHSQMVLRTIDLLPELLAYVTSSACRTPTGDKSSLAAFERGLAQRLTSLAEVLIQQAAADYVSCYDPGGLEEQLRARIAGLTKMAAMASPADQPKET